MHLKYRKTCRICGSASLKPVIDLGDQYLQGSFVKDGYPMPPLRKIPTQLVRCDVQQDETACGLLQMAHSVPPDVLYSNYWYRSGTNATMTNHLRGIADSAGSIVEGAHLRVLDIGCNDGTLLKSYPDGFEKYGVDPSDIAKTIGQPVTVVSSVFPSALAMSTLGRQQFDIVTSIAMFYDLEDPVGFAKAIESQLGPRGIWIFEMSYLPMMLDTNSFDTICHEHLEYYSLAALEAILVRANLRLFRISFNDINGGSIRCYVTNATNVDYGTKEDADFVRATRLKEFDIALDTDAPYVAFQERISEVREKVTSLLKKLKADGKVVHIYGASTKGNTLLQWCGIDSSVIPFAAERNPDKFGSRTLGTNIKIISEAESRAANPDYYLVLPWHFRDEFIDREKDLLRSGTKMIFPLPQVLVVGDGGIEPV